MANTRRESTTSHRRGDSSSLTRAVPSPSSDYSPRIFTAADPTCQQINNLSFPIREPLISRILGAVETTLELHRRTNGATVSVIRGNLAGRRLFAVSIYPERTIELTAQPSWGQLFAFALANFELLLMPERAIGTWFNVQEGVHVLDVVLCLADRDAAIDLGLRFHQWSIFDLAAGREIRIRRASRLLRPNHTEPRQ
jgi:hypothetical protein